MYALKGFSAFKDQTYPELASKYKELKLTQKPKTLFITCSDSRILPNHITNTGPGDLFCIRNAGNFIASKEELTGPDSNVATIEYGVNILAVKEIVVCGHARCGAVDAGINQDVDTNTELGKYLTQFKDIKSLFKQGEISDLKEAIVVNVKKQIRNLMSYDFIAEKVNKGELLLSGWYYDFEVGDVEVVHSEGKLNGEIQ